MARVKDRGFSLVELMIAIGILATAIILIMGVFLMGLDASQKGADLTAGTVVARFILDEYIYGMDFAGMPSPATGSTLPAGTGTYALNNTNYSYSIDVTAVDHDLKKLDVSVWWWGSSPGSSTRAGQGQLKTNLSCLVYRFKR